jgi:probable rRNA maturation factor
MNVLRVLNRQKTCAIDRRFLGQIGRSLLRELIERENFELGLNLVGAAEMAQINEGFLRHAGPTDVITFDYAEPNSTFLRGEIFICVDVALNYARRYRTSWQSEVVRYTVHGVLHLEGFDDATPTKRRGMKRRENKLLKELSRRFDLGKLGKLDKTVGPHERK